jgi:hypothetical protein
MISGICFLEKPHQINAAVLKLKKSPHLTNLIFLIILKKFLLIQELVRVVF